MLRQKIRVVNCQKIISKMKISYKEKREYGNLMKAYLMSAYDVMVVSKSNIKLGGNISVINPVFKKKGEKKIKRTNN